MFLFDTSDVYILVSLLVHKHVYLVCIYLTVVLFCNNPQLKV